MINNISAIIEKLKKEDKFFIDSNTGEIWSCFKQGSKMGSAMVLSEDYEDHILCVCNKLNDTSITPDSVVKNICKTIVAYIKNECQPVILGLRVASNDGSIYYDLCNENGQIVKITKNKLHIINDCPIPFKNYGDQKTQVMPIENHKVKLKSIFNYLNISSEYNLLFLITLITYFIPDIQHPIIYLYGEAGQGKSTISTIIKELVDPCFSESVSLPKKNEEFNLILSQNWVTVFDNVSKITPEMSDNICRAVTGITTKKRIHYSNTKLLRLYVKQCIVINGIEIAALKEDLISRCVFFKVEKQNNLYRSNENLLFEFIKNKPFYLEKIFNIISRAKCEFENLDYNPKTRMADYEKYCYAIAKAMGAEKAYIKQFNNMLNRKNEEMINNNSLVLCLINFLNKQPEKEWSGSPEKLLKALNNIAYKKMIDTRSETMPHSAQELGKKLNAYNNILKIANINVKKCHTNLGTRYSIYFKKALS